MEAAGFRIRVDLTQIISGIESRSLMYIDPAQDHTIADIERRIKHLFTIEYNIALVTSDHFLPITESVHILRDGDVVSVVKSPRSSGKSTGHKHEENSVTSGTSIFKFESNAIANQSESKCHIDDKTDEVPKSNRKDRKNKEKHVLFTTLNSDCDEYVKPKKKRRKYLLEDIKSEVSEENVENLAKKKKKKKKKKYLLEVVKSEVWEENVENSVTKPNEESADIILTPKPMDIIDTGKLEMEVEFSNTKLETPLLAKGEIETLNDLFDIPEAESSTNSVNESDIKGQIGSAVPSTTLKCYSIDNNIATPNDFFDVPEAEGIIQLKRQTNIIDDKKIENEKQTDATSATLEINASSKSSIETVDKLCGNASQVEWNIRKRCRTRRKKKRSGDQNMTKKCDVQQNSSGGLFSVSASPIFSDAARSKHVRFSFDNTAIDPQSPIASSELSTHSDNWSLGLESSCKEEKRAKWDKKTAVSNSSPCVIRSKKSAVDVTTDTISSPKWSVDDLVERTDSKRPHSTPLVFETKRTQFVTSNGDNVISDLKSPATEFTIPSLDLALLDPNTYPYLQGTPRRNDFLAFKILRMGHDYTPQLSEFLTAKVSNFCPETFEVNLEVIDSLDQLEEPKGRFHLMDDAEENSNSNIKSANIKLNWNEMLESRLLYP